MWFDGKRKENTLYVASVSRGKDSTAMLRAIQIMDWPLDAIISTDIWFDDDTPAELPDMVAFKDDWDKKCFENFGIEVTRVCALANIDKKRKTESCYEKYDGTDEYKLTYCDIFYRRVPAERERERESIHKRAQLQGGYCDSWIPANLWKLVQVGIENRYIYSFPTNKNRWCTGELKGFNKRKFLDKPSGTKGEKINIVQYIGIANDEHIRIAKHINKKDQIMPLVQIGWDEDLCGLCATYMDMLSPTYNNSYRDGCWFCHLQSVNSLRLLRKNHKDLWKKLMKIDDDSPVTFQSDGKTVHDFDKRFMAEDLGLVPTDRKFRWKMLDVIEL